MILETVRILGENDPSAHGLLTALDRACKRIDWSNPGDEEFYESLHEADDLLNREIDGMDKSSPITVNCVGHTHIDLAWLWRIKHTREKGARSFATVLRMMELFPEYIFLQTQPQLYAWIKEDHP